MISVGNRDDFDVMEERFAMPFDKSEANALLKEERSQNFYYSFDYGWIHVISISTTTQYKYTRGSQQYMWLENDLKQAASRMHDSHENLRWIILMGHNPMYSSSDGHTGGNKELAEAIEHLLVKYNVSIAIWGDDHIYERSYPIFNNVSDSTHNLVDGVQHFVQPGKPVHLLVGTGGIDLDGFLSKDAPYWSAYREKTHGWLRVEAGKESIEVKFIRKSDGAVRDRFFLVKGPEGNFIINVGSKFHIWLILFPLICGVIYFARRKRVLSSSYSARSVQAPLTFRNI